MRIPLKLLSFTVCLIITKSGFLIIEERIDRFKNIQIQICKFSRKKLILLMRAGRWLYRPARECRLVGGRGRIGAHACRGGPRTRHSTLAGQASRAALRRRPPQHSHRQVTHLSCPLLIINCLHHYPVPSML